MIYRIPVEMFHDIFGEIENDCKILNVRETKSGGAKGIANFEHSARNEQTKRN